MDDKKIYLEHAKRAAYGARFRFTRFLDPSEEREVLYAAAEAGVHAAFYGGYEDAERRIAAFYVDDAPDAFPVTALEIRWNEKFGHLAHRDLLGAVMSLGIERSVTGDICIGKAPGTAYLFCTDEMADYLCVSLTKAGRMPLKLSIAENIEIAPPEGTAMRITVNQLRLDALVAAGYRLSRNEAQQLIRAGLVKLNHVPEERCDARAEEGSLLSVRGYGRMKITEIEGETKKGRIGVKVFRYGAK